MVRTKCVVVRDGPPDPEKRTAPLTDIRSAAKQKADSKQAQKTTKPSKQTQEPDRNLAVYFGRELLGLVNGTEGRFRAILPGGTVLGRFATVKAAGDAISAARKGAQ